MEVVRAECEAGRCTMHDKTDTQAGLDGMFVLVVNRRGYDRS